LETSKIAANMNHLTAERERKENEKDLNDIIIAICDHNINRIGAFESS
jgi:hypothetical protein